MKDTSFDIVQLIKISRLFALLGLILDYFCLLYFKETFCFLRDVVFLDFLLNQVPFFPHGTALFILVNSMLVFVELVD